MKYIEDWCCHALKGWQIACSNRIDIGEKPRDFLTASPITFIRNNNLKLCPFCGDRVEIFIDKQKTTPPLTN